MSNELPAERSNTESARDLTALPKAHLHVHLEGAMRPGTLRERAERDAIPVPPIRGFGGFTAFSGMYVAACQVLQTPADLRRLVFEVVEDALATIARSSIEASGAPDAVKASARPAIEGWLAAG